MSLQQKNREFLKKLLSFFNLFTVILALWRCREIKQIEMEVEKIEQIKDEKEK